MHLWDEARVAIYGRLRRWLPVSVRNWIGGSALTAPLRRSILWPSGRKNLVETHVSFHGHEFLFGAPVKVATAVRTTGGIENGLCRLVLAECPSGGVALDIGANYGFVTLVMAQAVGITGQVHSFEAAAPIYDAFVSNLERNELQGRCRAVHAFVGDVSDGSSRISIDDYVARNQIARVDFIKIDVDGPDLQVLKGARKTLERFHPLVVIELTRDHEAILGLLLELGYQCADMQGRDVDRAAWPLNLLAAVGRRLAVPMRNPHQPH